MLNAFKVFTQTNSKQTFKRYALGIAAFAATNTVTYKLNEYFTHSNGWCPLDPTMTPEQMNEHARRRNRFD